MITIKKSEELIHELGEMERCVPELIRNTHGHEELEFMEKYLDHFHKLRSIIDDAIIDSFK